MAELSIPSSEADDLVRRAIRGDEDAFAELFRVTLPIVWGHLYGRCGDAALAEDLASDTYMRAMRAIGRFEGGSREFLAWVLTIARNLFYDHVKSGRMKWEVVVDEMPVRPSVSDPEGEVLGGVEGDVLREALEELTAEQQEVVHLRFFLGLPIADVAEVTGRKEGAIKALQYRALRSLARVLEGEERLDRD